MCALWCECGDAGVCACVRTDDALPAGLGVVAEVAVVTRGIGFGHEHGHVLAHHFDQSVAEEFLRTHGLRRQSHHPLNLLLFPRLRDDKKEA